MKAHFYLGIYSKHADEWLRDVYLPTTIENVRAAFGLGDDDYPGDCLIVNESHIEWLSSQTAEQIDLDEYDYSVDVSSDGPP
jgi:hypothetical protein